MKSDLQGTWKLEESDNYFEFRGNQFCTGELDEKGNLLPCSEYSSFTTEENILVLNKEPFLKASWRWEIKHGKLELTGVKPNGEKSKFIFSKFKEKSHKKITFLNLVKIFVIIFIAVSLFGAFYSILIGYLTTKNQNVFYVNSDVVNIRSCAGTTAPCEIIGKLYKNETIEFEDPTSLDKLPNWIPVEYQGGTGYVSKSFLSAKKPE